MIVQHRISGLRLLVESAIEEARNLELKVLDQILSMAQLELIEKASQISAQSGHSIDGELGNELSPSPNTMSNRPKIVGSWLWDMRTGLLQAEPNVAVLFGVNPDLARRGTSITSFVNSIHPDDQDRVWNEIERTVRLGDAYHTAHRVGGHSGSYRKILAIGSATFAGTGANRKALNFSGMIIEQ